MLDPLHLVNIRLPRWQKSPLDESGGHAKSWC
jgi:hypothetical protein